MSLLNVLEKKKIYIFFVFKMEILVVFLQTGKSDANQQKGPVKPIPKFSTRKEPIGHFRKFGKTGIFMKSGCKRIKKASCIKHFNYRVYFLFTFKNNCCVFFPFC